MTVPVHSKHTIEANKHLFAAAVSGFLCYNFWPASTDPVQAHILWGLGALIFTVSLAKGLYFTLRDYLLRRAIAKSQDISTDHGSAREATTKEIKQRKMDKPDSGMLLGHNGKVPVFAPPKTPFSLFEIPPGGGKTSCYVLGSIIHKARQGCSLVITDPKLELGPMLAPALRDAGFEVWCINPKRAYPEICENTELSLFCLVLDSLYAPQGDREDTSSYASDYALLILPEQPDEKQPYFPSGSRRCIVIAILFLALTDPAHCTPSHVYNLLSDPERFQYVLQEICDFLETDIPNDPLVFFLKLEAANLLNRTEHSSDQFGSFIEGATQKLLAFNPSGRLGSYGSQAIHSISDIRKRQVIVFIMAPLSHKKNFEKFIALHNYNAIEACKANDKGHPVHIVAEEALSYRFIDLSSNLETVRGMKVTADFYIQSFSGLVKLYGKDEAAAIESYMDVRVYAALNSYERAKFVSDMLSDVTLRQQSYSFQGRHVEDMSLSSREQSRKFQQPNEILQMPRGTAWTFVRGMHPMCLDMIHFSNVSPWNKMITYHPVEGPIKPGKTFVHIDYTKKGACSSCV